jgi:GNAT superfamily N-acetyltransferase
MEPPSSRPSDSTRISRWTKITSAWLTRPNQRFVKATLTGGPDAGKVIGMAGWFAPNLSSQEKNISIWRRDSVSEFNLQAIMDWSDDEVAEMWSHYDLKTWQENFEFWDGVRTGIMKGEPHWVLAPLWVLPEYQGRGVGGSLVNFGIQLADAETPRRPMYLEAMKDARVVYERFGWVAVGGDGDVVAMVRRS